MTDTKRLSKELVLAIDWAAAEYKYLEELKAELKKVEAEKEIKKELKDDWQNDGSWRVVLELPAGLVQEAIGKLNSWTHGEAIVEVKVK